MEVSETKTTRMCDKHNCVMEVASHNIGGCIMQHKYCPECDKEAEAKSKVAEAKDRQYAINQALDNAMISPRFRQKTLENYFVSTVDEAERTGQQKALNAAWWFIANWQESSGLVLIGKTGTGKNHICSGIVNEFVKTPGKTALCTEPVKMIRAIKESWRGSGEDRESDILKNFRKIDLLVIDEIGVQFGSDTERMYLTEIINDRYNWLKPTILSGNVSLAELKSIIGERVVDRFREGGRLVVFDWKSYRGNGGKNV